MVKTNERTTGLVISEVPNLLVCSLRETGTSDLAHLRRVIAAATTSSRIKLRSTTNATTAIGVTVRSDDSKTDGESALSKP